MPRALDFARPLRLALCVAGAVLLQGCIDVREEIRIREDGSARYVLDVSVPQEAVSLGDARRVPGVEAPDLGAAFRAMAESARRRSRDVAAVSGFEATDTLDGCGNRHFRVQLDVADAESLGRVQQDIFAGLDDADGDRPRRRREHRRSDLEIEELSDENLGVLRQLSPDGVLGINDEAGRLLVSALGQSALAGRDVVIVVMGPSIVSANGRIAADRRSVEWHVPLARLLAGTADPVDLRAEVSVPEASWPWIAMFLVVALVGGLGAIAWLRRQQPETWRG